MADSITSGFHVTVTGEVSGAQITGGDDVYCKYSFNYGVDWTVSHGLEHGISQVARRSATRSGQTFAWNYPIDISFQSTNVFGWPQLVLTCYSLSLSGKDIVRGYGSVHVPTTPGRHIRYVRMYTPVSSSWCQRFTSWLTGNPPEYFSAKFIAQGKGREVTRVSSSGTIKIIFNVATRNMNEWGYDVTGERQNNNNNNNINNNINNINTNQAVNTYNNPSSSSSSLPSSLSSSSSSGVSASHFRSTRVFNPQQQQQQYYGGSLFINPNNNNNINNNNINNNNNNNNNNINNNNSINKPLSIGGAPGSTYEPLPSTLGNIGMKYPYNGPSASYNNNNNNNINNNNINNNIINNNSSSSSSSSSGSVTSTG